MPRGNLGSWVLKGSLGEAISTASMVYWALDLPLSCATGVYHKGTVLLTQPAVAKQYFMSWFASDLMLVLVDWVTFVVVSVDESRERSGCWKGLGF